MAIKIITVWDFPASVKEHNRIEFDHESNQYHVMKGIFFNIPSDHRMYHYGSDTEITHVSLPFAEITLWDSAAYPQITFFNHDHRGMI